MIKTLKISEELHTKLKTHCAKHKLKLNEWAEELLTVNLKYDVLIEYLNSFKDIEYMKDKLKEAVEATNPIEVEKRKKQLYLMGDCRVVFAEAFLKKIKKENETLTTKHE